MSLVLSRGSVLRLLRGLLLGELQATTRRHLSYLDAAAWPDDQPLDAEGLGLDSLERLGCAAAVNQFFQMHETGLEDYLLTETRLDGWANMVQAALVDGTSGVTVTTSGSTGTPKPCPHPHEVLLAEARFWADRARGTGRVIQLVPPHHIYGYLLTVLVPELLGVPVLDGRVMSPARLRAAMTEGGTCLLIGHPSALGPLARSLPTFPPGVDIVSSTAPLAAALHAQLRGQGAASVTEIYGSTETAGIGYRVAPDAPFTLLPRWRAGGAGQQGSVVDVETGRQHDLPDRAEWVDARSLRLLGRKDQAVQVGGVNVFPSAVAASMRQHRLVRECAVRLDETLADPRLKALIVLQPDVEPAQAVREIEDWCRTRFSAAERPVRIDVADALPRNEMGKPADWQHAA